MCWWCTCLFSIETKYANFKSNWYETIVCTRIVHSPYDFDEWMSRMTGLIKLVRGEGAVVLSPKSADHHEIYIYKLYEFCTYQSVSKVTTHWINKAVLFDITSISGLIKCYRTHHYTPIEFRRKQSVVTYTIYQQHHGVSNNYWYRGPKISLSKRFPNSNDDKILCETVYLSVKFRLRRSIKKPEKILKKITNCV